MKKFFSFLFVSFFAITVSAQQLVVNKIEPPNWWSGMKLNRIQLMVYGSNLNDVSVNFNDPSIKVTRIHKIENPSYAFIDIEIPNKLPSGKYQLIFQKGKQKTSFTYSILKREKEKKRHQGFSNEDVIYLLMPDRFANGDTSNDSIVGYSDYMNKIKGQGRAGGDLQGVINKLDYIKDLGFTAIWLTPVVENNTFRSYHGYSATDFYKVDPRLGSNELYKNLVEEAHKSGLKIILDHVANHCSDNHPWIKNLPTKRWFNGSLENHLDANHNKMVFTDLYADSATIKHVERGWFVRSMPDLNQENPFVANYIIQNTIWWMEYAGIDGIREDTYPYNNQKFISRWAKTLLNEYPTTKIVGEVWTGEADFLSTYQSNSIYRNKINTYLSSVTDFPLRDVLVKFLQGQNNLYNLYNLFAKDFLYKEPSQLVTFVDNHDVGRAMYFANGNIDKVKIAYTILLTTRGIPQIFYGSEIGMAGTEDHGALRMPFPGGFPNDERNAFIFEGRTKDENELFGFIKELLHLRKSYPALAKGKMTHFPPENDVYTYFKTLRNEKMMIVINNNRTAMEIDMRPMKNMITEKNNIINIKTNEKYSISTEMKLKISPLSAEIFKVLE